MRKFTLDPSMEGRITLDDGQVTNISGTYIKDKGWKCESVITWQGKKLSIKCHLFEAVGKLADPKALDAVNWLIQNFEKEILKALGTETISKQLNNRVTSKELVDSFVKSPVKFYTIAGYEGGGLELDLDTQCPLCHPEREASFTPMQLLWHNRKITDVTGND